ncbi:hypothetical protein PCYB_031030, partial [Plasmodium cynomolgi strain B]
MYSNYSRLLSDVKTDTESNLDKLNSDKSNNNKKKKKTATKSDIINKLRSFNIFKIADSYYENRVLDRINNIYKVVNDQNIDDKTFWLTVLRNMSMIYAFPSLLFLSGCFFLSISERGSNLRSFVILLISWLVFFYTYTKILKYNVLFEPKDKYEFGNHIYTFKILFI